MFPGNRKIDWLLTEYLSMRREGLHRDPLCLRTVACLTSSPVRCGCISAFRLCRAPRDLPPSSRPAAITITSRSTLGKAGAVRHRPKDRPGPHHIAFVYPTRAALGRALRRLRAAGVQLIGASDHGGAEAIYLRDPDDNGVELYWDRPEKEWPRNAVAR